MKSLSLTQPHLLVMVGVPGAGKTFFASQFADMFNAPCVSFDLIRAAISSDNPIYSHDEQAAIERIALDQLNQLLVTRSTIIVDGGSETRVSRQRFAKLARSNGYKTLFIWVQTDPATAKQRSTVGTRGRGSQPILLTDEQYNILTRRFTPPNDNEPSIVISGKHTYATQAKTILKKLSEPRASQAGTVQPPADRLHKQGHRVIIR